MQAQTLPEAQPAWGHGPGSSSVHCSALHKLKLRRGGFPGWGLAWAVLRLAHVRSVVKGFVYRRLYPAAWQAMTLTFPEPGAVCLCFGFYKFQRLFFAASTFLCERKPDGSSVPCSV